MNAQDRVARAVEARGYRDGWSDEQYAARQVAKLGEELGEAVENVATLGRAAHLNAERASWEETVKSSAYWARMAFDYMPMWERAAVLDSEALASEAADLQVVLFTLADVLGVDVVQAAITKAEADVNRGVRSD